MLEPSPTIVAPAIVNSWGMDPAVRMVNGSPLWNWPVPESIQPLASRPSAPVSFHGACQMSMPEEEWRMSRLLVPYSWRKSLGSSTLLPEISADSLGFQSIAWAYV